jgi:peptide/nickel transport system permease protein
MGRYIRRRSATAVLTVFLSIALNFLLIRLAPGDPISYITGQDFPSPELRAELTAKYGFDRPLIVQFGVYLRSLLSGDLGQSIAGNRPVADIIGERIGPTLLLALTSAIGALLVGTSLGVYSARRPGSKFDTAMNGISYVFDSMPPFWLGMMLSLIFASWLKLLPTSGMVDLRAGYTGFAHALDVLKHLILPAATVVLVTFPYFFRVARTSVIQAMSDDYVVTFRAAGMNENRIFYKYVFRNAMLPTITAFGLTLAYVVAGVAIVEIVFAWPGTGSLMMSAIMQRDYPLLMGLYLIISISVAVTMIVLDLVYALADPRIRYH